MNGNRNKKWGDFLPKCAFFYEIWVENRPKIALFVLWSNPFGEEQQVLAGFIDVEGEDEIGRAHV